MEYLKSTGITEYNCIETLLDPSRTLSERRNAAKSLVEKALEPHGGMVTGDIVLIKINL